MELSRRKFIRGGLAAAGTVAALGGIGLARGLFSGDVHADELDRGENTRESREPGYLALERSGELARREQALWAQLERCRLCPRNCDVNRLAGVAGICSTAQNFKIASFGPHFGEEAPLRGANGSGTIFFADCNLLCVFCINWQIAHRGDGTQANHAQLASAMLELQRKGCHNINLVSPTHILPHIVKALRLAIADGLRLPLVYNSGGYESLEVLKQLDGVVDIYLPDFKYMSQSVAARFSQGAPDYVRHTTEGIKEMHRQVGLLRRTGGIAYRGLLIRHLVLPQNMAGTDAFVRWVASDLGTETHVNIMNQYTPMFRANEYPPLDRRVTQAEFTQAMTWARAAGLRNFH